MQTPTPATNRPAPLRLVWSALWRAQASHLLVFVAAPLAVAAVSAALSIVFLPFLLLGGGDRSISLAEGVRHLAQPSCWVALAPCPLADNDVLRLDMPASTGRPPDAAAPAAADADDDRGILLNVRHLWFAAWLLWFVAYLVRRERRRRSTAIREAL